eukprot:Awhi_evm1s10318
MQHIKYLHALLDSSLWVNHLKSVGREPCDRCQALYGKVSEMKTYWDNFYTIEKSFDLDRLLLCQDQVDDFYLLRDIEKEFQLKHRTNHQGFRHTKDKGLIYPVRKNLIHHFNDMNYRDIVIPDDVQYEQTDSEDSKSNLSGDNSKAEGNG